MKEIKEDIKYTLNSLKLLISSGDEKIIEEKMDLENRQGTFFCIIMLLLAIIYFLMIYIIIDYVPLKITTIFTTAILMMIIIIAMMAILTIAIYIQYIVEDLKPKKED